MPRGPKSSTSIEPIVFESFHSYTHNVKKKYKSTKNFKCMFQNLYMCEVNYF